MTHKSQEELKRDLDNAHALVEVGSRYAHFKDPSKMYVIRDLAIMEETMEVSVIYAGEYGEHLPFIRPLSNFLGTVEVGGVSSVRFQRVA